MAIEGDDPVARLEARVAGGSVVETRRAQRRAGRLLGRGRSGPPGRRGRPALGAELVGDPEGVVGRDGEAEVVVVLAAASRRRGEGQAAADQAEPLAAEVGHQGTAVAGMQGGGDLDQAAERPWPSSRRRSSPEISPRSTEWPRPNGLPMTSTWLPSRRRVRADADRPRRRRA